MGLSSGTKLGPYEIQSPLGAGGMGEVYRARDLRLGREVAIKVLPADCSSDPDRLRRFEQEARATAALNHPNILAVFDIGQQDGKSYIVSELLEGETLRARLNSGPLLPRKAIEYAVQIARGLAAAHAHGILHRDLKPENIFVTRDGHIKILDFGVAKLTLRQPSATTVELVTKGGVLLGTIAYMSPEQVRGGSVDVRSDLFSFGAVLYEMVSGRRAFTGNTTADTISAILREEPPDLNATARDLPPMLDRIVRHCLEKDPAARFQSARDIAFDLESLTTISAPLPLAIANTLEKRGSWMIPALLGLTAILLGIVGWLMVRLSTAHAPAPEYHPLTFARERISYARFTPDYHTVVYSSAHIGGENELFSVTPESLGPVNLGLKDTDVESISSSGEMLLVQQRRRLNAYAGVGILARAPLTGGAPRPILSDVQDADWGPDNQIAVARLEGGRFRLEYPIGHVLYETSGYVSDMRVSPKGDLVAFADHPLVGDNSGTVVVVDSSGHRRALSSPQSGILGLAWLPSGKEIWFSAADVGTTIPLKAVDLSGHMRVVASVPGSLVIHDIAPSGSVLLRHESSRGITSAFGPGQNEERDLTIRDWTLVNGISADGRQALLEEEGTGSHPGYDVYVRATDGSAPVRLGGGHGLDFSPNTKWVLTAIFVQHPSPLILIPLGPGEPKQITQDAIDHTDARFLPDGNTIVFTGTEPGHKPRIYVQAIGSSIPRAISPEGVTGAIPSADGKFVFGFSDQVGLYPVDGSGEPRTVPGIHPDERIAGVLSDGRSVLVQLVVDYVSLRISRVDLASGHREPFKKIEPRDPAGLDMPPTAQFTPDGKYYAYCYGRTLGALYQVEGLR